MLLIPFCLIPLVTSCSLEFRGLPCIPLGGHHSRTFWSSLSSFNLRTWPYQFNCLYICNRTPHSLILIFFFYNIFYNLEHIDICFDSKFLLNFHVSAPYFIIYLLFVVCSYLSVLKYTIQHCCYCSIFINSFLVRFIYFYHQIFKFFTSSNTTFLIFQYIKSLISAP